MNIKKYFNWKIGVGVIMIIIGIILLSYSLDSATGVISPTGEPHTYYPLPVWLVFSIIPLFILGLIVLIWGILEKILQRIGKSKKILNIVAIVVFILFTVGTGFLFNLFYWRSNYQIPAETRLECIARGTTSNEFDILDREFVENPNQNALDFKIETKNIGDNLYEKKISLDIFEGCEILTYEYSDKYKLIGILGFDDFNMDGYPVLPMLYLNFIELPKDSIIQEVKIQGTLPTEIKNIRLPAFNDYPPVVGAPAEPFYVDVDENQYFDPITNPLWSQSDSLNCKDVYLRLIPVVYDAIEKTATVYSKIEASIVYKTTKTGILHNIGLEGNSNVGYFNTNESISAIIILENATDETQEYTAEIKLLDMMGRPLRELSENISIESNKRIVKEIDLGKVAKMNFNYHLGSAGFFLKVNMFDSQNKEFGHQEKQFTVYEK
ncbi:MAG: hypothetical protein U9Q16_01815 [Patescibacteria group bacterium]|nr:hypothetical protein [Patescibacteria group bacterium]